MKFNTKQLLPFIFIVVGLFALPVGLILISIGFFWLAINSKKNRAVNAPQDDQVDTPSPAYYTPQPQPTEAALPKKTETHRVAGTSFRLDDIEGLMGENSAYSYSKKELIDYGYIDERVYEFDSYNGPAVLEPEPDNPHDPKAVKVIAAGVHIGYIKAGSCARIHKLLREDGIEKVVVEIKGGKYKKLVEGYDDYSDKFNYSIERDSIPISAVLTLTLKQ